MSSSRIPYQPIAIVLVMAASACTTGDAGPAMDDAIRVYQIGQEQHHVRENRYANPSDLKLGPVGIYTLLGGVQVQILTATTAGHSALISYKGIVCGIQVGNAPAPLTYDHPPGRPSCTPQPCARTTVTPRLQWFARIFPFVSLEGSCDRDAESEPRLAIAVKAPTRVWGSIMMSGTPVAELAFGERVIPRQPIPRPSGEASQPIRVQLLTGEMGWVSAADIGVDAEPAVITRATGVRSEPRTNSPEGEVLPRMARVAVSDVDTPWVFVTAADGQPSGWIPDGRISRRVEDITLAGLLADLESTPPAGNRVERLSRLAARPGLSGSAFAPDLHMTIAAAQRGVTDGRTPSSGTRPSMTWLGHQLGLSDPDRFAVAATIAARRQPMYLQRFESSWRPDCSSSCLFAMAGSIQRLMADSTLIPLLFEAVRTAPSAGYVASLNALRTLGEDLEAAALRATLDAPNTARAVTAARSLRERGDSSGVRWVRRVLRDPTLDDLAAVRTLAVEFGIASGADHITELDRSDILDTLPPSQVRRFLGDALHGPAPADRETSVAIIRALEDRPTLWTTLVYVFLGTEAMNDPELRNDVAAIAYRLMMASDDSVQIFDPRADLHAWQALGVMFAELYPSAALTTAVIATLDDRPHPDAYQAQTQFVDRQKFLVKLTGLDTAPYLDLPSPENLTRAHKFWNTWWTEHVDEFRPVSAVRGSQAVENWKQGRWR